MFTTARRRCLQTASSCASSSLPSPVIRPSRIAFDTAAARAFSTSTPCRSKIGRQPLFLPPEVQFEITQPPKSKKVKISVRDEAGVTVTVKGPLGELSYTVPSFVRITRETPTSPPSVSVLDANERCQREMWGTSSLGKFEPSIVNTHRTRVGNMHFGWTWEHPHCSLAYT